MKILHKDELLKEYSNRVNPTFSQFSALLKESDFLLSQKCIIALNNLLTNDYKEAVNYFDSIFYRYGNECFKAILDIKNKDEKIKELQSLSIDMVLCKVGLHMSNYTQMLKYEHLKEFVQTRDFSFNNNELNDFIYLSLQNKKFNDKEMTHFINLMHNIKQENDETREVIRNNLSYIHTLHLSYFCFLISTFISSIEFKEKLPNNYQKRGYYYTYFVEFLNLLDNDTILNLAKSYFTINLKDSNAIKKDKICQEEKKSHYIQGAFLKRVIGEKMKFFNADKEIIKGVKDPDLENPYCILYIYGTTINEEDKKSIENKLAGGIECYFNNFLDYIQINDIRNSPSYKLGKKIKLYQEVNLYLILNYIRTPAFLDDLFLGFNIFLQPKGEMLLKGNPKKSSERLVNTLNPFENQLVFKNLQLIFIETILDNIENDILFSPNDILSKINQYTNESTYLKEFLILVVNKLYTFRNTCWEYEIIDKPINTFSDNLFILKSKMHKELFENSENISLAYFPINKDKVLFLKNNKQNSKELYNYVINQENIMLVNNRNKFIVQTV